MSRSVVQILTLEITFFSRRTIEIMTPKNNIWIFVGEGGRFPSSAFTNLACAKKWVETHGLSGVLSAMPIDQGVFQWALENDAVNMKPETLEIKSKDSLFIGTFTTGSLDHFHYEDGKCE